MKWWKNIGLAVLACLAAAGALFLGLVALNVFDDVWYRDKVPPKTLQAVRDFRKWKPAYTNTYRVSVRGSTYYLIEGEFARFFPSGPAAYIFDANGNFVEWTSDSLDFYHARIVFSRAAKQEPITPEELPNQAPEDTSLRADPQR